KAALPNVKTAAGSPVASRRPGLESLFVTSESMRSARFPLQLLSATTGRPAKPSIQSLSPSRAMSSHLQLVQFIYELRRRLNDLIPWAGVNNGSRRPKGGWESHRQHCFGHGLELFDAL